jgi:hypothetical protein
MTGQSITLLFMLCRVYAVHFAARQFSGNAGTAISSGSNSCNSLVGGLGLAWDAAHEADHALCVALQNLLDIRKRIIAYATHQYRYDEQYDPDTGEPLFNEQQVLRFREITNVLESLGEDLRSQDERALTLGMTDGMQQQLLKPAGFRQLQVCPVFGTDAGAEVLARQLDVWRAMKEEQAAGSVEGRNAAALATAACKVEDDWRSCPMRVINVSLQSQAWPVKCVWLMLKQHHICLC